jgi:hypothetical protein
MSSDFQIRRVGALTLSLAYQLSSYLPFPLDPGTISRIQAPGLSNQINQCLARRAPSGIGSKLVTNLCHQAHDIGTI